MRNRFDEHSVISRIAQQIVTNWIIRDPIVCSYFKNKNIALTPESLFYAKSYPGLKEAVYTTQSLMEQRKRSDQRRSYDDQMGSSLDWIVSCDYCARNRRAAPEVKVAAEYAQLQLRVRFHRHARNGCGRP